MKLYSSVVTNCESDTQSCVDYELSSYIPVCKTSITDHFNADT